MSKEQIRVQCLSLDERAVGLVKWNGEEIRVPYLLPGEKAVVELDDKKKYAGGKVIRLEEKSVDRVNPPCGQFNACGACQLQHMSYEAQLRFKEGECSRLLKKYGTINPIIGMEKPVNYRNKIHSTLTSDKRGVVSSGMYEEYSHKIIPIKNCMIQDSRADLIIATILSMMKSFKMTAYHEDSGQGFLRHILVKVGFQSNQIMVVLVVSNQIFPGKNNFVKALRLKHPEISTILLNVNNQKTSMVLGQQEMVIYGKGFIEDTLCGVVFQISAKSFYQINPIQTEKLYNKAIEMAGLTGQETVLDAYCGIGTIGLIASKKAKKVIGVELNKDAVKDAINNAKRNNIQNIKFFQGDAGEFMNACSEDKESIDVVLMDPPRTGSDEKFLSALVKLAPKKVVYVSCEPTTLERDLKFLVKNGYKVMEIQPLDMFPHTYHVETVVLLSHKKSQASSPSL